jgi:hypothetical protein
MFHARLKSGDSGVSAKRPGGLAFGQRQKIITLMHPAVGYFWRFYFTLASEGPPVVRR